MATATGFKKLEEKVAAAKPLTITEQNIVNRASGTPTIKPVQPPAPAPAPLFKSSNPIQEKLDTAAAQQKMPGFAYDQRSPKSLAEQQADFKANPPSPYLNKSPTELVNSELGTSADLYQGLFPNSGYTPPTTVQGVIDEQQAKNKQQQDYLNQQQGFQGQQQAIQTQQMERQNAAGIAGNTAALAQGREGPQSAGAPQAMSQYRSIVEQQTTLYKNQLAQNQAQMAQAQRELQQAQQAGDVALAGRIQGRMTALQQQQVQTNLAIEESARKDEQVNIQKAESVSTAFTNFSKLPAGIFSTLNTAEIAAGAGVDLQTAQMLKTLDAQRVKLQPTDPDYLKKVAELNKTIEETKYVGMTESQKDYLTYKNLLITDPEYAEKFAQKTNLSPTAKEQAETLKAQQENNLNEYDSSGVYNPIYSKYGVNYTPNGVRINVEANTVLDRWQCGAFFNDVIFGGPNAKGAGDSYTSKLAMVNSDVPVAGGGLVFNTGDKTGHVGIVERVYPDGSIDIVDSNRKKNAQGIGIVDRTHLKPGDAWYSYISGYVDPAKFYSKGKNDEKDSLLALVKAGNMTDSELTKLARQSSRQGWGDEFRTALKDTTGGEQSSILAQVPKDLRGAVVQKAGSFDTEQGVKSFQILQNTLNKVSNIPDNTTNPADDQALVYAFAKAMDPASAVKEGEYETVQQNAQSSLERFGVTAKRFYSNTPFLSEEARKNIKASIKKSYDAEESAYNQIRKEYTRNINNLAGTNVGEDILQNYALNGSASSKYKRALQSSETDPNL